jgi:hypothetical protein
VQIGNRRAERSWSTGLADTGGHVHDLRAVQAGFVTAGSLLCRASARHSPRAVVRPGRFARRQAREARNQTQEILVISRAGRAPGGRAGRSAAFSGVVPWWGGGG